MNVKWHAENKLPRNVSKSEREFWHLLHQKVCRCRPVPKSIQKEWKKFEKMSWGELTEPLVKAKKKIREEDVVDLVRRVRRESIKTKKG